MNKTEAEIGTSHSQPQTNPNDLLEILKQQLSQSRGKLAGAVHSGPESPHHQGGFMARPHSRTTSTVESLTNTKVSTLI